MDEPSFDTHPFDQAVALHPLPEGRWQARTWPQWANMVGPFGGITAAQALAAVLRDARRLGDPVSLTVNYCAALADGPFEIEAQPVRTNRSTQHWMLTLRQSGEVVMTGTAFTALRRDTWGADEQVMPEVGAPLDVPLPAGRGRVEWINRYEMRFVAGGFPAAWDGTDHGLSRTQLWMRDNPPRALDHASLAAFADIFFPRIWRRRATLVPIGTVSMTVYFHADAARMARTGSGYLLGQAQAQAFSGGYFDQTAQLWNEGGELLATTHQIVYYKE